MQTTHSANPVQVNATRILEVTDVTVRVEGAGQSSPDLALRLEDGRNYTANAAMTARHTPVAGDYLITQEDGYEYLNPKDVFERKYAAIKEAPTTIGTPFEGGFYGGKIRIGIAIFAIVWAPKAEGEITGKWLDSYTDVPGATSCFDSMTNTKAMAAAGSPIAQTALAVTINGHSDWCVPARDVLEMGYRYLKPTTEENACTFRDGDNASSIPAGYPYTETDPVQSTVEAFQAGNAEAFDDVSYVSSTQYSEDFAWDQYFDNGTQITLNKDDERRCRFVRLIPLNPSTL